MPDVTTATEPTVATGSEIPTHPLPDSWKLISLEHVTIRAPQVDVAKRPDWRFKYVDVSSVSNKSLEITGFTEYQGADAPSRARKTIQSGDVLFATVRPSLKRIAIVPSDLDAQICSTAFCVIRPNQTIADPAFLFHVVSSDDFVRRIAANETGVSYPAVTDRVVLSEVIALPPLPEQREIARVLSIIRRAGQTARDVIDAIGEMKRSLMVTVFQGRDQTSSEHQQTKTSRIHDGWTVDQLGNLFDIQQGKALSPASRLGVSARPFLRTANVLWGRLELTTVDQMDFSDDEAKFYALRPGDLLICEGGDIGRTAIWNGEITPCFYQNHLHRLRPKMEEIVPLFYMYWMDAAINLLGLYGGVGNRTTIPNLSKGRLSTFLVPVPDRSDQDRIASQLRALDGKLLSEKIRLNELEGLNQTLRNELLNGKLRLMKGATSIA